VPQRCVVVRQNYDAQYCTGIADAKKPNFSWVAGPLRGILMFFALDLSYDKDCLLLVDLDSTGSRISAT
jgi:hypothetical protein